MAKKKTNKNDKSSRDARLPFIKNMRKARADGLKNDQSAEAANNHEEIENLMKSIIKEFSVIGKSEGLVTGTNEVLRLLEKEKLIAVFINKAKVSYIIREYLYTIGRQTGVPVLSLKDGDKDIFGPDFPKSITYGIKNEPFPDLENLKSLLKRFANRNKKSEDDINVDKNNEPVSISDFSHNEFELQSKEATNQAILDTSTFYHSHEGHVSKKSDIGKIGYLSLNKFSVDDSETDFLDYDSVAFSGILSIK